MKPLKFPAILVSCLLILPGCFEKTKTVGHETEVYVIADEDTWQALEQPLRTAFQRTVNTPQPENVFDVYWVEPDKFSEFAQRKNLVLVGTLNADGKISQQVANMLSG